MEHPLWINPGMLADLLRAAQPRRSCSPKLMPAHAHARSCRAQVATPAADAQLQPAAGRVRKARLKRVLARIMPCLGDHPRAMPAAPGRQGSSAAELHNLRLSHGSLHCASAAHDTLPLMPRA